jgi:hypothetical protein
MNHNFPELKYRTVVLLKPRQDVNAVAEKLYRLNFDSKEKISIREYKRTDTEIVYLVADKDEIEPLYLIKKRNDALRSIHQQKTA